MGLYVEPALMQRFPEFYPFAMDGIAPVSPVLVVEKADDQMLEDLVREHMDTVCIVVRDCPQLQTLVPLAMLKELQWVGVWRCPNLSTLWQTTATPLVRGIAFTGCKQVTDLSALAGARKLEHLLLENRTWDNVQLKSLLPLCALSELRTLDLGCRKVKDGNPLDYHRLFPNLKVLTITPGLRRVFVSREGKRDKPFGFSLF
ncbi:hypothetical protein [uncultured Ruthenibacterium sp.]|uniref:hypothetical protein n=1 Tax=uncultured Ruthenibacterium sp. TaxID=1905347 RepID=UPI00349EC5D5